MQDYFIGLDMGTGSVGWAVTDQQYRVLRRHGKALWGVRLFESAETAEERLSQRISNNISFEKIPHGDNGDARYSFGIFGDAPYDEAPRSFSSVR